MKLAMGRSVSEDKTPASRRGFFLAESMAWRPGIGARESEARRGGGASITPETRRDGEAKVAARWRGLSSTLANSIGMHAVSTGGVSRFVRDHSL
jgi:hypothetical protein